MGLTDGFQIWERNETGDDKRKITITNRPLLLGE